MELFLVYYITGFFTHLIMFIVLDCFVARRDVTVYDVKCMVIVSCIPALREGMLVCIVLDHIRERFSINFYDKRVLFRARKVSK